LIACGDTSLALVLGQVVLTSNVLHRVRLESEVGRYRESSVCDDHLKVHASHVECVVRTKAKNKGCTSEHGRSDLEIIGAAADEL
jgi:hypothetical protein